MVKLVEEARRSRTPATQQAVVDEDAGAEPEVDGAAGSGGGGGGGGGDPAVATDPKKYCWNCKTSDHAAKLRVCSGCNRVRYFLLDGMFNPHPHTLAASCLITEKLHILAQPRR